MVASNTKSKKVKAAAPAEKEKPVKKEVAKAKDKAPKRSGNAGKNAKPGFFKRIGNYIKSTFTELKKVNWLSGEELFKSTLVVFGMVAVLTVIVWIMDTGLGALTAWLLNL